MEKTCVIYSRVPEDNHTPSIATQVKACCSYAKKNNYDVQDIFVDGAKSGEGKRVVLEEMISCLKKLKASEQAVLIYDTTVISNDKKEFESIETRMYRYAHYWVSVSEEMQTETPEEKMVSDIVRAVNEFNAGLLGVRVIEK